MLEDGSKMAGGTTQKEKKKGMPTRNGTIVTSNNWGP
jgi:hypothetical protein